MVAIRLRRLGSKKRPFFRIVVIDSHAARDGRSVEVLGYYNPTSQPETFQLDRARLQHWLNRGAQLSDTVRTLVARHKDDATADSPAVSAPPAAAAPAPEAPAAESSGSSSS